MIKRLNETDAREVLRNGRIGHLGCIANGFPYVVPMHYLIDGDSVYLHSLPGRKINALRENPNACFQVDHIRDEFHWHSVIVNGSYIEIADQQQRSRILQHLFEKFPNLTPVESALAADAEPSTVIVISIRIETITALGEGPTSF